ncbi:MAG: PspC domain-containing protein [Candidatus Limnocylindrales bacterium]
MNERLYRSREDRMLAGVAGGLADLWDADPSLVRIIWALLVVFTGGLALVVYIVMAIVVPDGDPYVRPMPGAVPPADPLDAASPPTASAPVAASGWTAPSATDADRTPRRAARAGRNARRGSRDGAPGALIVGALLVLLGTFFLAREFLPEIDFDWFWPLVLVVIGIVVVVSALGRGPGDGPSGNGPSGGGTSA